MKLHILTNDKMAVDNGTALLSWCVTKEEIDQLRDRNASDPQLLIIIVPTEDYRRDRQQRQLIPLSNLQGYVMFHAPGKNRIFAFLITKGNEELLERRGRDDFVFRFLSEDNPDTFLKPDIITADEPDEEDIVISPLPYDLLDFGVVIAYDSVDAMVPKELFGKPTPEWEVPWLTWMVRDRQIIDECHRRKIRMLYPFQSAAFLIYYLFRILMFGFMFMFGCFRGSLRMFTHPLSLDIPTVFNDAPYAFDLDKKLMWILAPFTPAVPILGMLLGFLMVGNVNASYLTHMFLPLIIPAIIVGAIYAVAIVVGGIFLGYHMLVKGRESLTEWITSRGKTSDLWYMNDDAMIDLTCMDTPPPMRYEDIPKERRTFRLRFWKTKSRVCKPFAL